MKLIVIGNDREIVDIIGTTFQVGWPGTEIIHANTCEEGPSIVESVNPDAVILDLNLLDTDGNETIKQIRSFSHVPIILLTTDTEESNIVRSLYWGADDCMIKPLHKFELLARLKTIMRRQNAPENTNLYDYGILKLDHVKRQAYVNNKWIKLTRSETLILNYLMIHAGKVISPTKLADVISEEAYIKTPRNIKVYIRRIREKLEINPSEPCIIKTIARLGYSAPK